MGSGKIKVYYYSQSTQITSLGILDQEMGYIVTFRPRSSGSRLNQYLSVGEANVLKLEFFFYENDGIVFKVKSGWVKYGSIYFYYSKRRAAKQFHCIQKAFHALGFTTLDVT